MNAKEIAEAERDIVQKGIHGVNGITILLTNFRNECSQKNDEYDEYDSDDGDKSNNGKVLSLLHALRRSFSCILERGDLVIKQSNIEDDNKALDDYTKWLKTKYFDFILLLSKLLVHKRPVYQVAALRTLMYFIQKDGLRFGKTANKFSLPIYSLILRTILSHKGSNLMDDTLGRTLLTEFVNSYEDVRYHTLLAIQKMCYSRLSKMNSDCKDASSDEDEEENSESEASDMEEDNEDEDTDIQNSGILKYRVSSLNTMSMDIFCDNFLALLQNIPGEVQDEIKAKDLWVNATKFSKKKSTKRFQQGAFQKAWVSFLLLPNIPASTCHDVLLFLPDQVLPHLMNPLLLSDFLTDAYNVGGATSMMAMSSLFILISQHGLDYPKFYEKLYALLGIEIFHAKYRAKFFELLETFLSSTHLSSYLVAAFAKKLARLALYSSPGAAMFILLFISNLLKRHPSCLFLVHKPTQQELLIEKGEVDTDDINQAIRSKLDSIKEASLNIALGLGAKKRKMVEIQDKSDDVKKNTELELQKDRVDIDKSLCDPFLFDESDPSKCHAIESCLWEIESLGKHYCPSVATLVKSLFYVELKETVETKVVNPPASVVELTNVTYKSLIDDEIHKGRKRQRVAFAFSDRYRKQDSISSQGIFSFV